MKQCMNCQKALNDNAKFCVYCGTKCEASSPASDQPVQNAPLNPSLTIDLKQLLPTSADAVLSDEPKLNLLKKNASGLTYFIFLLLYSLFACVSFFYIFTSELPGMDFLNDIMGKFGLSIYTLKSYLPSLDTLTILYRFAKALGMLPIILICIGIWKFYLACKQPGNTVGHSNGLILIEIPVIISFIGYALGAILILIGGGLLTSALDKWWIFLIALALCLISLIDLFYASMILRLLLNARQILESPTPTSAISYGWVLIVFNFISAVYHLFFGANGVLGNLLCAASVTAITICLIQYKNNINTYWLSSSEAE